jgi:hypothetical protein
MAVYNEILVGRFNRALQKAFGIKGPPAVPQLAGEIAPNISMLWGAETKYLEGWGLFGAGGNPGPVAAQTAAWQIRNPATSNTVGVLERLWVGSSGGDTINFSVSFTNTADLASPISGTRMDSRIQSQSGALAASSQTNIAGFATFYGFIFVIANTSVEAINGVEWPLLPGTTVRVNTSNVNTQMTVMAQWRERFLEEGERV